MTAGGQQPGQRRTGAVIGRRKPGADAFFVSAKEKRERAEIAEKIREYEERAQHLMRMAAGMQSEAMKLYAEIAVLSRYRNAAWAIAAKVDAELQEAGS